MGIFDIHKQIKYGHQRISENFLKKMGFKKSNQWGSPRNWGPDTVFWEKTVVYDSIEHRDKNEKLIPGCVDVWYFPHTFKGYVTPFSYPKTSQDKIMCICGLGSVEDDYHGDALCKNDIVFAIDYANQILNKYNNL